MVDVKARKKRKEKAKLLDQFIMTFMEDGRVLVTVPKGEVLNILKVMSNVLFQGSGKKRRIKQTLYQNDLCG